MNWPPNTRRFLFWTILTAVFHGLLCQLLAAVLNLADGALTQHRYWSVLLWLPLVRGVSVIIIPALTVGFTLGHKRGIYKPLVTLPLGVATYWVYRWWFWVLPWFVRSPRTISRLSSYRLGWRGGVTVWRRGGVLSNHRRQQTTSPRRR